MHDIKQKVDIWFSFGLGAALSRFHLVEHPTLTCVDRWRRNSAALVALFVALLARSHH